ncbi:MAG: N-acetylmuramoyl-L-alanine amidase [Rikenellaceae bacterium]
MPYRLLLTIFCLLFISIIQAQDNQTVKIRTVVIDPGHGGHDPGAISPNRRVYEKNITLSVALKLGALIKDKYPDIQVIYTRTTDVFIPLITRTDIANKNHANLFVSIHVNSAKARSASGSETFVMGMDKSSSNLEVTMLENSVIALEGDHESKYEGFDPNNPESYIIFSLLQNAHLEQSLIMASLIQDQFSKGAIKINRGIKQGGLLVLWKTTMPAVLVELGFISNSSDYKELINTNNHYQFANSIFRAFEDFKIQYEHGSKIVADVEMKTEKQAPQKADSEDSPHFRIQILAVTKILPKNSSDLRGEKNVQYIRVGKFYKYSVGEFSSKEEAANELKNIKKKFPQAFIIKVEKGTIVPL